MLTKLCSIMCSCKYLLMCPHFPRIIWIVFVLEFTLELVLSCSKATMLIICINFWNLDSKLAIVILHSALFIRGIFYLIGSWLADSYFGKFNVFLMSWVLINFIVYPLIYLGTFDTFTMDQQKLIFITTFFILNVFVFGIECRIPLYGEQFFLPHEEKNLRRFFIVLFWIKNLSKFIGGLIIPIIIDHTECYQPACFKIPFLICVILNFSHLATLIYYRKSFINRNRYYFKIVERNMHLYFHALWIKCTTIKHRTARRQTFLEYAYDIYDRSSIQKAQRLLYLIPLFISFLTFWSIREQLQSIWIIQSTYLYHDYYFFYAPQRIALINPCFNLILIPIVYSVRHNKWHAYLKWIGTGYLFMCISSCISASLEYTIERSEKLESINSSQLFIYNTLSTPVEAEWSIAWFRKLKLEPFERKQYNNLYFSDERVQLFIQFNSTLKKGFDIKVIDKQSVSYLITDHDLIRMKGTDPHKIGYRAKVYFMCPQEFSKGMNIKLKSVYFHSIKYKQISNIDERVTFILKLPGRYKIYLNDTEIYCTIFNNGHIYSALVLGNSEFNTTVRFYEVVIKNHVHLYRIIPQFICSSIADTLSWISIEMFVYTQSPTYLRATTRGLYQLCQCFGSGILTIVFFFPGRFRQFLIFFSVVSVIFFILYIYLSLRYRYKVQADDPSTIQT